MIKKLRLNEIRIDGGTQPRVEINNALVKEYADEIKSNRSSWFRIKKIFPPLDVFYDGKSYWLVDGFHRRHAYAREGVAQVDCQITDGTLEEARWASLSKNHAHGLRRTNEDKREAVKTALKLKPELSDRAIAEWCGVSDKTVSAARAEIPHLKTPSQPQTRIGKDGKNYPAPPPCPPQPEDGPPKIMQFPPVPVEPEKPKVPPVPVDGIGRPIPSTAMETWARRHEAQEVLRHVSEIRAAIKKAQDSRDILWAEINLNDMHAQIDNLYAQLKPLVPEYVCPGCQGLADCRLCNGRRMVSKFRWDTVVTEIQKKRATDEAKKLSEKRS
jgi:hypothetical protein